MSPLLDAVDLGILVVGAHSRIEFVNRWVRERVPPELELVGRRLEELAADGHAVEPRLIAAVDAALQKGQSKRLSHAFHPTPLPLFAPDSVEAERLRQAVDVIAQPTAADGLRRCLVQVRDMTEIVRREQQLKDQARRLAVELERVSAAQAELERQSLRFRELARLAPVGLLETDATGRTCFYNERAARMLSIPEDTAIGTPWLSLLPAGAQQRVAERWRAALAGGALLQSEVGVMRADGGRAWLRLDGTPIGGTAELGLGHIVTLTDVSDLRESATLHEYRANHDPLTGIANRNRLAAALEEAIVAREERVAVFFIDLDRFKPVNDRHGHAAGDAVLKAVAERLTRAMRPHDTVGRLGGDEFGVVVRRAPDDAVLHQLMQRLADAIAAPVLFQGMELSVGASIGLALYPEHGRDAKSLLDHADRSMYRCKTASRGRRDEPREDQPRPASVAG